MKTLLSLFLFAYISLLAKTTVLHVSLHKGCIRELEKVFSHFEEYELTSLYVHDEAPYSLDPQGYGSQLYNIGHDRAERIWKNKRAYFENFDVIITSDTTPLSRIFLQNGWKKPLIIWVCNRLDYTDTSCLDCDFPDEEYYALLKNAKELPNVAFATYMPFDFHHAKTRGVDLGHLSIQPCGFIGEEPKISAVPNSVDRSQTFFVPPYHNETNFMNLSEHLSNLGIKNWHGRYNGPADLKGFKGIICLPYSWATLSLYENLALGNIFFIPSREFYMRLLKMPNFFHPDPWMIQTRSLLYLSEWYCSEHEDLFVFFNSWEDLQRKILTTDYEEMHRRIHSYYLKHKQTMLDRWKRTLDDLSANTTALHAL